MNKMEKLNGESEAENEAVVAESWPAHAKLVTAIRE